MLNSFTVGSRTMQWKKRAAYTGAMVAALSWAAAAQESQPGAELKLKVETTLVLIPVSVTDSLNRFVLGLQKGDFHLFEDNEEQNVMHFSGEDVPLSVG